MELLSLYECMARARAFEAVLAGLWQAGAISGEMHLGTGEESVAAAIVAHAREGDAVALDHRPTPVLALLGVSWSAMLAEMLGREDGLCGGWGGHMHLLSRRHLAASSGIVGAAGPLGAGFALSARRLRPGSVAVSSFGDGAVNQGMLLETLNLASVWRLPLVMVCKDNGWAITTRSADVTAGDLCERARAFAMPAARVDGREVVEVAGAVGEAFARARAGRGPSFVQVVCPRLDGHFLGDPLVRTATHPASEGAEVFSKVLSAAFSRGGGKLGQRMQSMGHMVKVMAGARGDARGTAEDPLAHARKALEKEHPGAVRRIDATAAEEARMALHAVTEGGRGAP